MSIFASLMTDTVQVIKPNGEESRKVKASVQKNKIYIDDIRDLQIVRGDVIGRVRSDGVIEKYHVIDENFSEGLGQIPPHYNLNVQRI
ncbi:MAG: hypothetical protein FWG39_04305 [Alphaproteobacteria bacterium]|nr:hypothetical protein [Alphaproteobacteria bacterium]